MLSAEDDGTPRAELVVHTRCHELELVASVAALLPRIEQDVADARGRVWIETFIFRSDEAGRRMADALLAARARGVDVRVLYDPLGSRETDDALIEELREGGVDIRPYRSLGLSLRSGRPWPRDHARILCIGDVAYTGGVGFGDEWLARELGGQGWHDVCCRVRGPVVEDFAYAFEQRWLDSKEPRVPETIVGNRWPDLRFVADAPSDPHGVYRCYRERARRARSRIWIENAYFVPPRGLRRDLYAAARRGVDVQIVVPGESDLPILAGAARGEYAAWLAHGISIFEFPGVAHSKFAVIDDDWATIGSFNLNPTSLVYSNEANLFVKDPRFVELTAHVFARDRARSRRITAQDVSRRDLPARARDAGLHVGVRLLEAMTWFALGTFRRLPF